MPVKKSIKRNFGYGALGRGAKGAGGWRGIFGVLA
jgi:hypothetical protein